MKIRFVLTQLNPQVSGVAMRTLLETYTEIVAIDENCINERTFHFLKALELSEDFIKEVRQIRNESNLPIDGYDPLQWYPLEKPSIYGHPLLKEKAQIKQELLEHLADTFSIPPILHSSLADIVLLNCVFIPLPKISVEGVGSLSPKKSKSALKIVVNGIVTRTQVHDFIEQNWRDIDGALRSIENNEEKIYVSERDRRIIELRDVHKKSFSQIADIIGKEENDPEINEGSVKTACHRAKRLIKSLQK